MKRFVALILCGIASLQMALAAERSDPRDECAARLKTLGRMCLLYAGDNNGRMPPSLAELYYRAYVNDFKAFICPAKPAEILSRGEINDKSGYILSPAAEHEPRPIVQDRSPDNHGGAGINVFYSDGSVKWHPAQAQTPAAAAASGADKPASVPPESKPEQPPQPKPEEKSKPQEPPLGVTLVPGSVVTDVTLCLGLDANGSPIQPGIRFLASAKKIACRIAYKNAPANTDILVEWFCGDRIRARNLGTIDGSGRLMSYIYTASGEPFDAGRYRVGITVGDKKAATAHFQVD
jgi:hypothetical protein